MLALRNEMEAYQMWLNQMMEDGRLEKRVSVMEGAKVRNSNFPRIRVHLDSC